MTCLIFIILKMMCLNDVLNAIDCHKVDARYIRSVVDVHFAVALPPFTPCIWLWSLLADCGLACVVPLLSHVQADIQRLICNTY
jgi:hypothetical protein